MHSYSQQHFPNVLCQQQQDEIQAMLQQTVVTDTKYTDKDIEHVLNPKVNKNQKRSSVKNSIHSQFSAASENDQNFLISRDHSMGSDNIKNLDRSSGFQSDSDNAYNLSNHQDDIIQSQPDQPLDINQLFIRQFEQQHHSGLQQQALNQKPANYDLSSLKNFPYHKFYQEQKQLQTPLTLEQVQKEFPSFLVSRPSYKIEDTHREEVVKYGSELLEGKIQVGDVGSIQSKYLALNPNPTNKHQFYLAASTGTNTLLIHHLNSPSPLLIIQAFKHPDQQISTVKWSPTLQYLFVSTSNQYIKVFQMHETNRNFNVKQVKWLKTPVEVMALGFPKLKSSVRYCEFLEENPLKMLIVDDQYEIFVVEIRKTFLGMKPTLEKLPVKFNEFFMLKTIKITNDAIMAKAKSDITPHQSKSDPHHFDSSPARLIIVGGQSYVTIAILQPQFQILLVYDKQKHFPNAKTGGFPHICLVNATSSPTHPQIMIVWDKHMQIIQLQVKDLDPFTYKLHTVLKYTFPDSSVLVGNLSDTVIYQLTRLEIKIYSLAELMRFDRNLEAEDSHEYGQQQHVGIDRENDVLENQSHNIGENRKKQTKFAQCIYSRKLNYEQLFNGPQLQQAISNLTIQLPYLIHLSNLFPSCSHHLFTLFSNHYLTLSIKPFPQHIIQCIQHLNDWKVGLQLLGDSICGQVTQFDCLSVVGSRKMLREYALRYVEFLKLVVPDIEVNMEIWKQEMCFLFEVLIMAKEEAFLVGELVIRLTRISAELLRIYQPFILLGKVRKVDVGTVEAMLSVIDKKVGRRLIYGIRKGNIAGDDSELSHVMNNILIKHEMLLELIWINQLFGQYYTPFVILISRYQQLFTKAQSQFMIQIQHEQTTKNIQNITLLPLSHSKQSLLDLISFLCYDTLRKINCSRWGIHASDEQFNVSRVKAKLLLETLIPLFNARLAKMLVKNGKSEDLFEFIVGELITGNCLETLNELAQIEGQSLTATHPTIHNFITHIPYNLVVQRSQQSLYWQLLLRLMTNNLMTFNIIPGLYYLTLQHKQQSQSLIGLVELMIKERRETVKRQLDGVDAGEKEQMFDRLKMTDYVEVVKVVGESIDKEFEVLEFMLKCKRAHNVQLISYIQSLISKDNPNPTLLLLKPILQRHIKLLISISPQLTSSLLLQHYKPQLKQFLTFLQQFPREQLNLLRQILSHYSYGEELNVEKIKYLELLAINGEKERVMSQIREKMFPLDQAIEVCRKYEILEPWAFLLVKSGGTGNSTLAIQLYFRLIRQHLDNYIYNRKSHQKWLHLKSHMLTQLQKSINVCIQLDLKSTQHYQHQWFFIIQQLESLKNYVYKTCSPQVELGIKEIILETLYPELINCLLEQVTPKNLLEFLAQSLTSLEHQTSSLIVSQMVKSYFYEKQILKNAQLQVSLYQVQERKVIYEQILKGFITESKCSQCQRMDLQIKMHYSCGHDIHTTCNQDLKQCIVCKSNPIVMIQKQLAAKDKVQKSLCYNSLESHKKQTQEQIIRMSRQQKLKNFDEALMYTMVKFV